MEIFTQDDGVGFLDKNGDDGDLGCYVSRLSVISQIKKDNEFNRSLKRIMAGVQRIDREFYRIEYFLDEMIVDLASIVHGVLPEY